MFAANTADAYRGMGYAAASERLWQIHMSTAYARGEAAALLGERFVAQDLLQRACNVDGRQTTRPASPGDWIAEAYLDGLNSFVDGLDALPPEFEHAGAEPMHFTLDDIAARYRFTSWFQHKSWSEKMLIGRLMATHGVDWFRNLVRRFSPEDEAVGEMLNEPLQQLDPTVFALAYPEAAGRPPLSGSNNWAVTGSLSVSGRGMLATDPHQPHSIPNTFFYVHLNAPGFDVFGAAFPGVPHFMMGRTPELAWGLTTGFVDTYDVYIEDAEQTQTPGFSRQECIAVKGQGVRQFELDFSRHGVLLDRLTDSLGLTRPQERRWQTSLHWSLAEVPTSAGALACLPLATDAESFGEALYENDVCPLVNNIICVDRQDGLRRFIAATLPAREGVTGIVPLPGWDSRYDFRLSTEKELTVEVNPEKNYALTANDDTMGDEGPYPIHNFPASSARADRIRQLLDAGGPFSAQHFKTMQLDLVDLRAREVLAEILPILDDSEDDDARLAARLLEDWDCQASADSAPACLFYPFLDRFWPRRFMRSVLDEPLLSLVPVGAQSWNQFDVSDFLAARSPWLAHRGVLEASVVGCMAEAVAWVRAHLGTYPDRWRWGDLHRIRFQHRLSGKEWWSHMRVGDAESGGSATTLNMAMHVKGEDIPLQVYHGPAFRMIVDLAEEDRVHFVVAGGNGGRADSHFATNQFDAWLDGQYFEVRLDKLNIQQAFGWELLPA